MERERIMDDSDADRRLLERLALAAGPPGAEDDVRQIVRDALGDTGSLSHDRLGSIICTLAGNTTEPRVVLDGHLDEVGFLVQSIDAAGRLALLPLGGWWEHVLLAQRVTVLTEARRRIPGVIGSRPTHFLAPDERRKVLSIEQLYVDVGVASREEAQALGVRVGDPIVPHAEFLELAVEGVLSCKAFDNRVGIGLMIETLRAMARRPHPNTLIGVGAVQEEIGCRGARTASTITRPDVALVLEATPADDLPGGTEMQAVMGAGPQLRFVDPTALSNRRLLRFVDGVAAQLELPVQHAVRRSGGTDASTIQAHGAGVPTVVIGVPARYIHTHVSLIHWRDYVAARRLLIAVVERLDAATVESFTRY